MMTNTLDIARRIAQLYYPLSNESLAAFADILVCRKYKKGVRILDEGEVCKSMLFIEKGMTRQFYFKYGKDMTEHIGYENGIIICLESYFMQEPTNLVVEALEPVVVWEIPKAGIDYLSESYKDIGILYRKFMEVSLIISQQKADTLRFESAQERYAKLLKQHPEILKRAPLLYIASLLQMSPETLSRVRSIKA